MSRPVAWLLAVLASLSAASAAEPPGVAPRPPQAISTPEFLAHAVSTNRFEIASSQLALKKTQSSVVHGFAHQMVVDYAVAAMKLRQAVADAKLPPLREALDEIGRASCRESGERP